MEAQEFKTYRPFRNVEESEKYLGRKVKINGDTAKFVNAKLDGKRLWFDFLVEGKGHIEYTTLSAFYLVRIDEHPFGEECKNGNL